MVRTALTPTAETATIADSRWVTLSRHGAPVLALLPVGFPMPLAEPAVRLSPQRALHGRCR
jgi:hypothetical protein